MPSPPRTARERWKAFLSFIVVWVLAAVVGSAVLIYVTGRPESSLEPSEATPVTLDAHVDEPELLAPPEPEPVDSRPDSPPPSPPPPAKPRTSVRPSPAPAPARPRMSEAEKASKVATFIRSAAVATEAGDYEAATRAYVSALALDPNNFEVKILMTQVESLGALEAGEPEFTESATELTGGGTLPAELIIEILPAAPNRGDPYILRVRAHNKSNRSLALTSVELLDAHDSMHRERGRSSTPLAKQLGPKEVALLWERKAAWTAADRTGTILVAVTLADGSRLSKSLSW